MPLVLCRHTIGLLLGSLLAVGCHSPEAELLLNDGKVVVSESVTRSQQKHRKDYQTSRDPGAIRWLLGNTIKNGMSVKQVNHLLGEEGVREANSQWIKKGQSEYRVDDVIYHYGPDSKGTAYYLAFREGKLIYFDPAEFQGDPKSEKSNEFDKGRNKSSRDEPDEEDDLVEEDFGFGG